MDHTESNISPEQLQTALTVITKAEQLSSDHPYTKELQLATAKLYKSIRKKRKRERREADIAHDAAVTSKTATGALGRIDDETAGIQLKPSTSDDIAGYLTNPRGCYVCKKRFTQVDSFYHQLCPTCAKNSHIKRNANVNLTGRRALLTGGRAKIGMYIALRLLRDGAHTTITTRFPKDAARRFATMPDANEWIDRLCIVGIDLRDPSQVLSLADKISNLGHLDILINNACQTVRRSARAYGPLIEAEQEALRIDLPIPEIISLRRDKKDATKELDTTDLGYWKPSASKVAELALSYEAATLQRLEMGTAVDAGGLLPDIETDNSWTQSVDKVDPLELLEVQLCNQTAPFLLISRLRKALATSPNRRKYVVNVSAMEGQFSRGYKGPGHPHTNMSKAALNMLTRTSAQEMFESNKILMTAVDTGWITDERPHSDKIRLAKDGFHAPLDLSDGAARVYDPIVRGENGEDLYGVFLKDYAVYPW